MKDIIRLEKRIQAKIRQIENKEVTPQESNVGVLLNLLKGLDEASYEKHINLYSKALKSFKN